MTEYEAEIRERGELTIPKELRVRYDLAAKTVVKLVPRVEGILVRPKVKDPVAGLRGLARDVWPYDVSSVELVRSIRRRVDFEAKERL